MCATEYEANDMTTSQDIARAAADIYSGLQRGEHFPAAWRGKFDLDAGQAIMSGSFTIPTPLEAGDRALTSFGPVGRVSVQVD